MADFQSIGDRQNDSYPSKTFDGQENQSYGFVGANKLQTGTLRGTQVISSPDGSKIVLGSIPGTNEFGFALYDPSGNLVRKIVPTSDNFYNPQDNYNNSIRIGGAPDDGRTGIWVGNVGDDVTQSLEE